MIYPLGGLLIGAAIGATLARLRGGNGLDMGQWGAVLAMLGGLIGLAIVIGIDRAAIG